MAERLHHPGFFRRVIFGERLSQEKISEIEEYKAITKTLHLQRGLSIFYPAPGTVITPSYGFRGSHVYYNDTATAVINILSQAQLRWRKRRIIKGDGRNAKTHPENVDMVILRKAPMEEGHFKDN